MKAIRCIQLFFMALRVSAFTIVPAAMVRQPGQGVNGYIQRCNSYSLKQQQEDAVIEMTKEEMSFDQKSAFEPSLFMKIVEPSVDSSSNIPEDIAPIVASDIPTKISIEIETDEVSSEVEGTSVLEGLAWRGVVVILCALWASNFAAAKMVMAEPGVDSSLYALARFGVAAMALVPGSIAAVRRGAIDVETAKGAAICGGWVAFGYLGQTLGLLTTTASKSCVICSLHCIFVAIVAEMTRVSMSESKGEEDSFNLMRLVPAAVAVAGVAIVELKGAAGAPTIGDLLSFAQPIGFGLGYLQLEELMKKRPEAALPVSAIKLIVVALASFALFELSPFIFNVGTVEGGAMEAAQMLWPPRIPDFGAIISSPLALGGILYTGLVTTAIALWVESIAFKRVPATDASIILTTEPLFAAGAAAYFLGETFGVSDYVGATLIIGACILSVLLDKDESDEPCDPNEEECVAPQLYPIKE